MTSEVVQLTDLHATAAFAATIAGTLSPGEALLLIGDLGAGKTTFTKALGVALDIAEEITSPTFTILSPYPATFSFGAGTLLHIDAYRLGSVDGLDDLGLEELLDDRSVAVIEWGDLVASAFPTARSITFTVADDDTRTAEVRSC